MIKSRSEKGIGNKELYEYYKALAISKGREPVSFKTYITILNDFNLMLRDKIVYEAERVTLPYKLGDLYVKKFRHVYHEGNKPKWNVDFKATKEQGKTVYHFNEYGYKWKWYKWSCRVKGRKWYTFKACRKANRLIADAVKNKQLDFYA